MSMSSAPACCIINSSAQDDTPGGLWLLALPADPIPGFPLGPMGF